MTWTQCWLAIMAGLYDHSVDNILLWRSRGSGSRPVKVCDSEAKDADEARLSAASLAMTGDPCCAPIALTRKNVRRPAVSQFSPASSRHQTLLRQQASAVGCTFGTV